MGQARDVMDRLMAAMDAKDRETLAGCYAVDAVVRTPDHDAITGQQAIADYYSHFWEAMPDVRYERTATHEAGDVAVAEGFVVGTNTGQLRLPTGGTLPPTGRQLRVRSCDVTAVKDGVITSHHADFDQTELLGRLGLLPEPAQG